VNVTSMPCRLKMPASVPTHATLWKVARNAMAARVGNGSAAFTAPDGQTFRLTAAVAAIPNCRRVIEGLMISIPSILCFKTTARALPRS
jgi:hypothetical protein